MQHILGSTSSVFNHIYSQDLFHTLFGFNLEFLPLGKVGIHNSWLSYQEYANDYGNDQLLGYSG